MKILTVPQIRDADQFTIKNEPISSLNLMERASRQVAHWIQAKFSVNSQLLILVGSGNNGGDGLAIGRLLANEGYTIFVLAIMGDQGSADFECNLGKIKKLPQVTFLKDLKDFPDKARETIFLDAIFGSGLSRPIEGKIAEVIHQVNKFSGEKIAIDIPSGLFADQATAKGTIFRANFTLSFQFPKLAFFVPENYQFVGHWEVLDIGLHPSYIQEAKTDYSIYAHGNSTAGQLVLSPFAHKGDRGRAAVIAGGFSRMGASILALKGALHSGIGLLTAQVCKPCVDIVQIHVPEALILLDENEYVLGTQFDYSQQDVLVIGPAIGFANKTKLLLKGILETFKGQLIIDADALTILAENRELLEMLPENSILTPHPGEFKRLVGNYSNYFEALMQLKTFCMHHKVVVILKGRYTAVCNTDGKISFNTTGNNGMAKGGSGDFLCGILAGLSPRIKNPFETSKLAVFLHGKCGDLARQDEGEQVMTPSGMAKYLKYAFRTLNN